MGLFSQKPVTKASFVTMPEMLPNIPGGKAVNVSMEDGYLLIKQGKSGNEVKLPYDKITNANIMEETEEIEKNKSVIGRAVVGGILLGPAAAVVGGMSGLGKKKKSKSHYFYVIDYTSNDENKQIVFEISTPIESVRPFNKTLRDKLGLVDEVLELPDQESVTL